MSTKREVKDNVGKYPSKTITVTREVEIPTHKRIMEPEVHSTTPDLLKVASAGTWEVDKTVAPRVEELVIDEITELTPAEWETEEGRRSVYPIKNVKLFKTIREIRSNPNYNQLEGQLSNGELQILAAKCIKDIDEVIKNNEENPSEDFDLATEVTKIIDEVIKVEVDRISKVEDENIKKNPSEPSNTDESNGQEGEQSGRSSDREETGKKPKPAKPVPEEKNTEELPS